MKYMKEMIGSKIYTPGSVKPGSLGQFPNFAGSPPMRTNTPTDGVGPFKMNIINHPGGLVCASGGAVTVQALPLHVNAGKIVLWPIELPWVETVDPRSETFKFAVPPEVTVNATV